MFTSRRVTRALALALAGAVTVIAATSAAAAPLREPAQMPPAGIAAASTVHPDQPAPPRGTSVNPGQDPYRATRASRPDTAGNPDVTPYGAPAPDTSPTLAQERYLGSYGAPRPLSAPPAPSDETPWLLIWLSLTGALAIVAATATQRRRVRVRRRHAASPTA
jgi:hypothetical protein